jgi:hypothetical protein
MLTLAATHSLADINTLPWWAQLTIGVGLLALAAGLGWWASKREACFPALGSIAVGIAGLITIWRALFG